MDWFRDMQKTIHQWAKDWGFWDVDTLKPYVNIPEKLCLIHSEISEAMEDHRSSNYKAPLNAELHDDEGKPIGFATELADAVIRIMDLAEYCGIDLQRAIEEKHKYNTTRPHKHGKKY